MLLVANTRLVADQCGDKNSPNGNARDYIELQLLGTRPL